MKILNQFEDQDLNFHLGSQHLWLPYTQMKNHLPQLRVKSAKGVKITLQDNSTIFDGIASWWSVAHGYNHPHLVKALVNQAKNLSHIMLAGFAMDSTYQLAHRLCKFCEMDHIFFADSGSNAIEVAMKIAWQFHINHREINKTKFVSFKNSYHGDTTGAMSLADLNSGMHQKFAKILLNNFSLEIPKNQNDLEQFEDFIKTNQSQIAGLFIEPIVQCASGMKFHSAEILQAIFKICKDHKILIIADECATGFYRLGKKFAYQFTNQKPDILVIGKALTGGTISLASVLVTKEIYQSFLNDSLDFALMHGPTFIGNPLACSVANASLDLFENDDYQAKAKNIENILTKEFKNLAKQNLIKNFHVQGAIAVIYLELDWQKTLSLRKKFIEHKVFLRPFANCIYLMPSLNIKNSEIKIIVNAIKEVLTSYN